uniref:Uncharacterized protein n=1 Tax=Anguilla anguilla TaxID=7936 RepID=A0A0E9PXS1_ANGAN
MGKKNNLKVIGQTNRFPMLYSDVKLKCAQVSTMFDCMDGMKVDKLHSATIYRLPIVKTNRLKIV